MKTIYIFIFLFLSLSCSKSHLFESEKLWKTLPVQHQGRIKPFDTFAREVLKEVYGKSHYENKSAVEIVLFWLIVPEIWQDIPLIFVEKKLRKSLDIPFKRKHFSFEELNKNQKLALQFLELQSLEQKGESLDKYFKDLSQLQRRLLLFSGIQTGFLIRLEAPEKGDLWLSLAELTPAVQDKFKKLIKSYVSLISKEILENSKTFKLNKEAQDIQKKAKLFKKEMKEFQSLLPIYKKTRFKIKAEVFYNSINFFQVAWIFYLLFLISVNLLFIFRKMKIFKYSLSLALLGFIFHSCGMLFRSYIMSRPPVSNMFDTVIWVPFVALIVGFFFYLKGNKWPFIASAILSFVCLLLTNLAPEVLDGSLQPLEAVLRSSFWLTIHVLPITMSYAFFFIAFVLGDMTLIYYLVNRKQALIFSKKMYQTTYRLIQWGVVFLTGGTILGAVWADYSWGRFWGWDPKESWALITLLAYLAILHGKLVGWITPFRMSFCVVLMFFLVIMAWYGVNFVLGAGLHSYGFGSGGAIYVFAFFILHLILCLVIFFKIKNPKFFP
ncbi:MAG: cytochrome c biogenesis protein CcsA [Bdellovibrionales bacterium]|nr:cytochrome c biogenesis protein CcsA [Bdellovibrionales bacterium]